MQHETMTALVASTAHMTPEEAQRFEDGEPPINRTIWRSEYGYLFHVGQRGDLDGDVSAGLLAVIEYAWAHSIEWVRLDRDGEVIDGLPVAELE